MSKILTAEEVRDSVVDELGYTDFVSDYDIQEMITKAVNDYLAEGGEFVTYDEYRDLLKRVEEVERELKEQNFWKADRNHGHKDLADKLLSHQHEVPFTGF